MVYIATLDFQERGLWPLMLLLAVVAVISVIFTYRKMPELRGWRLGAGFLKILGVILLLLALLEPVFEQEVAKKGANIFINLIDNSESQNITEEGKDKSRSDRLREVLAQSGDDQWQGELKDRFKVHDYTFGERLLRRDDFTGLNFDGKSSTLQSALSDLRDRYEEKPVGGVLLLTDGNMSGFQADAGELDFPAPVYTVNTAEGSAGRDSNIRNVVVTQSIFEDAPVTIGADIVSVQSPATDVAVKVFDEKGTLLETQNYKISNGDTSEHVQSVHFSLKPAEPGVAFYKIEVEQKGADAEATLDNNVQYVVANREKGPYRILYVAGTFMWSGKFLNRAITDDKEMSLVRLIRVAKKEPRFEFLSRDGEETNPLFRGSGADTADEESYDQPVLKRLGVVDENELAKGFPLVAKDLFRYDAIILDRTEADFFRSDQQSLMREFVAKRGGGFLMLGGNHSLGYGNWQNTPIAEVLPVFIEGEMRYPKVLKERNEAIRDAKYAEGSPPPYQQKFDLTREGWLEPWARLRDDRVSEETRLASAINTFSINEIGAPKPGASVISSYQIKGQDATRYPALVTQSFGKGRSMVLPIADVWKGSIGNRERMQDLYKFWRQLCRKLIADVPRPVKTEVLVDSSRFPPTARIRTIVNNREYDPMSDAAVEITITDPNGDAHNIDGDLSLEKPGLYTAEFSAGQEGVYKATVVAKDSDNVVIGATEAGWVINPGLEEFQRLTGNADLLKELSARTGGEVVKLSEIDELVSRLEKKSVPVMETKRRPLWHSPWVLVLALACFMAEWGIKRWRGLP
ncbi:MAG: hypothetical protein ACI9R3_003437 [Verrucomicrobiales bacterium]|jgi:hypothetical protein